MNILVIENYVDSPLGIIKDVLGAEAVAFDLVRTFAGQPLPADADAHDGLIILGGSQNALDDEACPYLPHLASLARAFGAADKAVLGICLGAQVIARGFGATNILGRPVEFGYLPVAPLETARTDPVIGRLSGPTPLFHWHSDTFTLPMDATRLAVSNMTEIQAFRIGRAVYGIQFHLEVTPAIIERWCALAEQSLDEDLPGWRAALSGQRSAHAKAADAIGRDMARAWIGLVRD